MLAILLFIFITSSTACIPCTWNGQEYLSGQYLGYMRCCNGNWIPCPHDQDGYHCEWAYCGCIGPILDAQVDSKSVITPDYALTSDNRLYTQYVTLAKYCEEKQIYYAGEIMHSTEVHKDDLIIWDAMDINGTGNVVMRIEHYAVDKYHLNCCASIKVGFPPSCQVKVCCGTGCCC